MTAFEKTFDNAALDYDKSRPTYIEEIYEDILRYKPVNSDSNVLEIGLGTGKASRPILDTQCRFIGIDNLSCLKYNYSKWIVGVFSDPVLHIEKLKRD